MSEKPSQFPSFFGPAAAARQETRWRRVQQRQRPDDAKTFDEFRRRDARELGWGLGDVVRSEDVRILNEGSLDDFYEHVREELRRLDG